MTKAAGIAELTKLIAPAVTALGFEFVACEFHMSGRQGVVRIYIDKEGGVTIDDCSFVSRQVSAVLDVEDPITGRYELEVSSPGFDRLLVSAEHYQRFLGKRVKIKLHQPQNDRRNFTGTLQAVIDEKVEIIVDGQLFQLALADIEKANLVPEF